MANSGDIRAGRAAVELYVDQSELSKGLKQAETSIRNVDKNLGSMRAGMIANQFAVGLQDFAVVYQQSQDLGRALSAAANNAIQLMTMVNPIAGAITAAAIAGYQLWQVFSKTADEAERLAKAKKAAAEEDKKSLAAGKDMQKGLPGPEETRETLRGLKTKEDADARLDDLAEQRQWNAWALRERTRETEELRRKWVEAPSAFNLGLLQASGDKETELRKERDEIARQQAEITDYRKRLPNAPMLSNEEAASILQQAQDETTAANTAKDEERKRKAQQDSEKRASEAESLTLQFETPGERRERLSYKYKQMLDSWDIGEDTYNRAIASLDRKSQSVVGTFSGAALSGLSGSSPVLDLLRRSAKANEETAANTKKGAAFK